MSHSPLALNQLPVELLHRISHYLDIPDILRMRRVSRYLNGVSHCREVWSDAYRKAEFVRRPGPFPSQSARDLENALVSSFRFDRNLRLGSASERPTLKWREIHFTRLARAVGLGASLIFGRFLLIAFKEEVRCYDLDLEFDSKSGGSTIHRLPGVTIWSFDCASGIDIEGRPFAYVVLKERTRMAELYISIYSFNVGDQSDVTLDLLHQFERNAIITVGLGPRVIVVQGRSGYKTQADWFIFAFDVHTRTRFLFPSCISATWEALEMPDLYVGAEFAMARCISTSTHLLLTKSFYSRAVGWNTFFQVFVLPPPKINHPSPPASITLSCSHKGIIPDINVGGGVLLHDAVIDPSTQDVLIAIRVDVYEPPHRQSPISKHGILLLSNAPTSHDELGIVVFQPLGSLGQHSRILFHLPSFDGTGRMLYMSEQSPYYIVSAFEYDLHAKCGDNDDGEHTAKEVHYPCVLRFPTTPRRTLLDYDPYSGRICFEYTMTMPEASIIQIFDLAV